MQSASLTSNCLIADIDAMIILYVSSYIGLILLFSFSTNPIICFWRCKLYRTEMHRVFGLANSVSVVTTQRNTTQYERQITTQFLIVVLALSFDFYMIE